MPLESNIRVIIPAHNEADAVAKVIHDVPKIVKEIIVVDNASSDATSEIAKKAGATVLFEPKKGYGHACLKGLHYVEQQDQTDIVVFLDGDYSDYPEELEQLVSPILNENIDFTLGCRTRALREQGAMQPQQIFGNWLATRLMKMFFNSKFTDLGPFRAIKYPVLQTLNMEDKTYGWTVEMQLKILKKKYTYVEIPVNYRNRIGVSKVSGTLKGSIFAGIKILTWIFKYSFK
ncbi:MAG: glycosyltransferase family 2 protein [Flavobacteriaceae bacterium]|nr:glycosyltransferase family 2 protein [Flavobacteriaceae bacterium]